MPRAFVLFLLGFATISLAAEAPSQTPWTGDLDRMAERGLVRVLVPYGRTHFYYDRGAEHGVTVESVRAFERQLNRFREQTPRAPTKVVLIPTSRNRLIDDLIAGKGDIAAGNVVIADELRGLVDFSEPIGGVSAEVIVTASSGPKLASLNDLAGREVHVRRDTRYFESLTALNERFARDGKPLIAIAALPEELEDEDILEMLNAGLLQISVVDEWLGKLWASNVPKVRFYNSLRVRDQVRYGWAFRKGSPLLAADINAFMAGVGHKSGLSRAPIQRFARNAAGMPNARAAHELEKFHQTVRLFRKYGERYRFDYLMLAALGYQESRLNQKARGPGGYVGVMQITPSTGASMGVGNIHLLEPNIHAGAKYMDRLMSRYLSDATLDEQNRTLFALAAYNAGPSRMRLMRAEAAEQGLDPNRWFNNVECVVARRIGIKPTVHMRNIYQYYVAYKLAMEAAAKPRATINGSP